MESDLPTNFTAYRVAFHEVDISLDENLIVPWAHFFTLGLEYKRNNGNQSRKGG